MKAKIDDFLKIVEEMKLKTIVVEGKNDVKALRSLGLTNIIPINSQSLAEFVSKLKVKEIIILTDFDKEGKKLAARLRYLTEKYRIKSNPKLRREFMKFGKSLGKNKIEEFELGRMIAVSEIKNLRGDNYGEISANINKIHNKSHNKSERCGRETRCSGSNFWSDRRFIGN